MTASAAVAPVEGDLIARREGACGVIRHAEARHGEERRLAEV